MRKQLLAALAAVVFAPAALGHPGHAEASGFALGFAHPLAGWDHLLAMLAVGLWAAQTGGRALWALPASFLAMMSLGAGLSLSGVPVPAVELGIAGSVLVFGLLLAFAPRLPLMAGVGMAGLLALFHGAAHGTEMAPEVSALSYGLGFLAATALLHTAGMAAGLAARTGLGVTLLRTAGALVAAAGAVLIAG